MGDPKVASMLKKQPTGCDAQLGGMQTSK